MLPLFHQLASTVLAGMVAIPTGTYRPLHPAPGQATVRVAAFRLDRDAVTRGEFAAFVVGGAVLAFAPGLNSAFSAIGSQIITTQSSIR